MKNPWDFSVEFQNIHPRKLIQVPGEKVAYAPGT